MPQTSDNSHVHFSISNFIRMSCVFHVARLYVHGPSPIIILAAVDTEGKNKNSIKIARTRGRDVSQLVPLSCPLTWYFSNTVLEFLYSINFIYSLLHLIPSLHLPCQKKCILLAFKFMIFYLKNSQFHT